MDRFLVASHWPRLLKILEKAIRPQGQKICTTLQKMLDTVFGANLQISPTSPAQLRRTGSTFWEPRSVPISSSAGAIQGRHFAAPVGPLRDEKSPEKSGFTIAPWSWPTPLSNAPNAPLPWMRPSRSSMRSGACSRPAANNSNSTPAIPPCRQDKTALRGRPKIDTRASLQANRAVRKPDTSLTPETWFLKPRWTASNAIFLMPVANAVA